MAKIMINHVPHDIQNIGCAKKKKLNYVLANLQNQGWGQIKKKKQQLVP